MSILFYFNGSEYQYMQYYREKPQLQKRKKKEKKETEIKTVIIKNQLFLEVLSKWKSFIKKHTLFLGCENRNKFHNLFLVEQDVFLQLSGC